MHEVHSHQPSIYLMSVNKMKKEKENLVTKLPISKGRHKTGK